MTPNSHAQQSQRIPGQYHQGHQSNGDQTQGRVCEPVWYSKFKLTNNHTATYVPVLPKFNTILRYHQEISHIKDRKLFKFIKLHCWWMTMRDNVNEVICQCKIFEKFSTAPDPPKLFISITRKEPFSTWSINAVGPMTIAKNGPHTKNYIVAAVD